MSYDGNLRTLTITLTITPVRGVTFQAILTADSNAIRIERV